MTDDLLLHYNRELLNIRRAAASFAAENPRIAARLRLSEDAIEDPHVGRLIEGFAYLTARVRQRLDDDFPELTDALLNVLYPHFERPIPSMSILQLEPSPEMAEAHVVPRGTLIDTEPVDGEPCRFSTTSEVTLHPVAIRLASLGGRPIVAPETPKATNAAACLRLTLELTQPEATFAANAPQRLRFFLRGQPQVVYPLYELLLNDAVAVAFAEGANDPAPVVTDADMLKPVGFGEDEGLLPYGPSSHLGFRILTEYFAFPEKFLFVELTLPDRTELRGKGRTLDVFVYLRKAWPTLERSVNAATFALGCTPIVNLFPQTAEPVMMDRRSTQYRLIPDARRSRALEIYSIGDVRAIDAQGRRSPVRPFYGLDHSVGADDTADGGWWLASRTEGDPDNPGSEISMSIVDLDFRPDLPADGVLEVETLCLNRDRPERLPFGGGHPLMRMVDPSPLVGAMRMLTAPTATLRNINRQAGRWRLISHLSLNHLSLVSDGGLAALREMLMLYDFHDSAETRALIEGVIGVSSQMGTARVRAAGQSVFCRGIDVKLTFDESNFSGNGVYLMASVLERFLGLYASVNSFSRLTAAVKGRSEVLRTWPARAGDHVLL